MPLEGFYCVLAAESIQFCGSQFHLFPQYVSLKYIKGEMDLIDHTDKAIVKLPSVSFRLKVAIQEMMNLLILSVYETNIIYTLAKFCFRLLWSSTVVSLTWSDNIFY